MLTAHPHITRTWLEVEITGPDLEDMKDVLVIETTVPLSSPGADERINEWSSVMDEARRLLKAEGATFVRIVPAGVR